MGKAPKGSQDTARPDVKVHCAIIKYLSDYRKPFLFDSIINSMIEDGTILESEKSEVSAKIGQLKMMAPDGKFRLTDVMD